MQIESRPATIFCDIDGVLIHHSGDITSQHFHEVLLPGTLQTLTDWDRKGYKIILTTGRREGCRKETEKVLSKLGIIYDQMVMGIGGGPRYLINDYKANSQIATANAICLPRNKGIEDVDI